MKLHRSASAIVLALSIGAAGIAFAVELPIPSADNSAAQPNAPAPRTRQQIAHDRTIAAATRAHDAGMAATDALCTPDRALQARTRQAAEAAKRELDAAAQDEAELDSEVGNAHIGAISAGLAQNGIHASEEAERLQADTDAKWAAYGRLKDAKAADIVGAALQVVANPTPANNACPPPAPPRRNATATPPPAVPSLPATPTKSIGMLRNVNDQMFKAVLTQPGLRGRVETLMGLGGCDFNANAAMSRQSFTRQAGAYLNRMNDEDLRDTLTDGAMLDRIDAAFRRGQCAVAGPENNPVTPFPQTNRGQQDNGPYQYGYPDRLPNGNRGNPGIPMPGNGYGGYGGYGGGYGGGYIP